MTCPEAKPATVKNDFRRRLPIRANILRDHPTAVRLVLEVADLLLIAMCLLVISGIHMPGLDFERRVIIVQNNLLLLTTAGFSFLLAADLLRLYRSWRWSTLREVVFVIWTVWSLVALVVLLVAFATSPRRLTDTILYWILISPVVLTAWRALLYHVVRHLRAAGVNTRKVCIVGCDERALSLAEGIIMHRDEYGVRFMGFCDDRQVEAELAETVNSLGFLGGTELLVQKSFAREIDVVYIALPSDREKEVRDLIERLADATVSVHVLVPELFEPILYNEPREFGPLRTVSIYCTPFEDRFNAGLKRLEDLVLTSIILLFAALPMLAIAIAVLATSGRPIIYRQNRYGFGGKAVEVWKFRTMNVVESEQEFTQAVRNDPRITPLGSFLRRSSLDELPQLINVMQGSMSLIGPRPHAVKMNEDYRKQVKFYMQRHSVKPGITGWAQVNGWRGETADLEQMEMRVEHDLYYIRHWSILFDMQILFMTLFAIRAKNAY